MFSNSNADDARLGASLKYNLDEGQKLFQEGTTQCNFLAFYTDHTVNRIVLYVDQTMDRSKIVSCVLLGLARASGLNVGPRFETQWERGGLLASSDEKIFKQFVRGLERLLAVHLLENSKAGMDLMQINLTLSRLSLHELTGE